MASVSAGRAQCFCAMLCDRAYTQALDERRLVLHLDTAGVITHVISESTPADLFGAAASEMEGQPACNYLDVLKQGDSSSGTTGTQQNLLGIWPSSHRSHILNCFLPPPL
jgi:hypothetical protein